MARSGARAWRRGPVKPIRIVRGEIQEDVAVDENAATGVQALGQGGESLCHFCRVGALVPPRVSFIICFVVMPVLAVPRRRAMARCPRALAASGRGGLDWGRMRA